MESRFWKVHGITNTSGLLQSYFAETRSINDSMNLPKIEFISLEDNHIQNFLLILPSVLAHDTGHSCSESFIEGSFSQNNAFSFSISASFSSGVTVILSRNVPTIITWKLLQVA